MANSDDSDTSCSSDAAPPCPPVRVATADELGTLRVIEVPAGDKWDDAQIVGKWGKPDREQGIDVLCSSQRAPDDTEDTCFCISRVDGHMELLDPFSGAVLGQAAAWRPGSGGLSSESARVRHIQPLWRNAEGRMRILSCCRSGVVRVHQHPNDGGHMLKETASFGAALAINCANVDQEERLVAVGGEGSELRVWDLQAQRSLFEGRPPKPHAAYNHVDAAYLTAMSFVPRTESKLVAVGTAFHKMRLYDLRVHGRRPVFEMKWKEARITCLMPEPSGICIWLANGTGQIESLDLRKRVIDGSLKGQISGSVRALTAHPSRPLVASASLDRFIRIHHPVTRKLLLKKYVKYQLTGVGFLPPLDDWEGDDDDDDDEEEVGEQQDVSPRERRKRGVADCDAVHGSEERRKKGLRASE